MNIISIGKLASIGMEMKHIAVYWARETTAEKVLQSSASRQLWIENRSIEQGHIAFERNPGVLEFPRPGVQSGVSFPVVKDYTKKF